MAQVLVIEDDRDTRTFLSDFLCDDGHETDVAAEGLTGIEKATANVPDVILLDVQMPILDGFQVLEALQADERTSRVPVVMLSGKSELDDMARAFRLGAADYLGKPCSRTNLINAVNSVVPNSAMLEPPRDHPHREVPL